LEQVVDTGGSRLDLTLNDFSRFSRALSRLAVTIDTIAEKQHGNVDQSITDFRKAASNLNLTAANLRETSASLDTILLEAKQGKGTLGKVIRDDRLYNDIDSLAINLNLLAKDIRENPQRFVKVSVF
jgi:phospholipid/cholesterol/gamma-HCH transport system substrate-binding protein